MLFGCVFPSILHLAVQHKNGSLHTFAHWCILKGAFESALNTSIDIAIDMPSTHRLVDVFTAAAHLLNFDIFTTTTTKNNEKEAKWNDESVISRCSTFRFFSFLYRSHFTCISIQNTDRHTRILKFVSSVRERPYLGLLLEGWWMRTLNIWIWCECDVCSVNTLHYRSISAVCMCRKSTKRRFCRLYWLCRCV